MNNFWGDQINGEKKNERRHTRAKSGTVDRNMRRIWKVSTVRLFKKNDDLF
jgi:hypothetical protein